MKAQHWEQIKKETKKTPLIEDPVASIGDTLIRLHFPMVTWSYKRPLWDLQLKELGLSGFQRVYRS